MTEVEQVDSVKDLSKKKILAILDSNLELQGDIYNVKLFSCDKEGKNWLYSDVEGFLTFIINYQVKTKYLTIFDSTSFEKLFQYELYNGFLNYYQELAPEFRSFEIDSGFMGFQFETKEDAVNFDLIIKKISGLSNDLFAKPRVKKEDSKSREKTAENYCKILKEMYGSDDKYDETYAEDGTTIFKHNNFKILQNIEYNKEAKQFKFGNISEELKLMFLSFGIKKKDLERDADFAFTLFKKVIVGLGNENALKNTSIDSIEHVFPPPEKREELRRQEEAAEAKMNSVRNQRIQHKRKEGKAKPPTTKKPISKPVSTKPKPVSSQPKPVSSQPKPKPTVSTTSTKKGAVPPPPPPPPPPPSVPQAVPQVSTKVPPKKPPQNPKPPKEDKAQPIANEKIIKGTTSNFLQNALSTAINIRRHNLHLHDDDDNQEEEDDDW